MKTVLVVEDNKDNLEIITYALKRSGYEVIATETGEKGVELAPHVHSLWLWISICPELMVSRQSGKCAHPNWVPPFRSSPSPLMPWKGIEKKLWPLVAMATLKNRSIL